ncbi:hypothetical protein O6H91_16G045600 [Diphasiastrum complanatum]|uniref:Uncharacterized protein n=1 Tax=Diphasiastrum complanatum TaxID=34168 RepID=A0ACC2BCX0_DIPCM|nr:hypothetical protein O6H91_Y334500 [Diphasiastrum complanatum]KAJ7527267.1 hypothetical protein O6H91_16G045600 [Diphasiastrum complanatum]
MLSYHGRSSASGRRLFYCLCGSRGVGSKEVKAVLLASLLLLTLTAAWLWLVFSVNTCCFHLHHQSVDALDGLSPPRTFNWSVNGGSPFSITSSAWPQVNTSSGNLRLRNLVFGVAGTVQFWPKRKEFIKLWWRPGQMRGFVWLDEPAQQEAGLPLVMVSEDTSRFRYTNVIGQPAGIRISRIVLETFRLHLPDVSWFVLCDDDTIFSVDNLVRVLSKYDPSQFYYIGSTSESHRQNLAFSFRMAYGGGGFAISYALAEALVEMQDNCLERYPELSGSDDRLHACISELGVPLTREPGFHQCDIFGNALGLLATHPVTPFVSLHHVEVMDPLIPGMSSHDGLRLLTKAMHTEPGSFLQQSICYDHKQGLSFSISTGFVVQVFPEILFPSQLERAEITFRAWNRGNGPGEFDLDTRKPKSVCKQPYLFYLDDIQSMEESSSVVSIYKRDVLTDERKKYCWSRPFPPNRVHRIQVQSKPLNMNWYMVPRRQCCKAGSIKDETLNLFIGSCLSKEILVR